YRGVDALDRTYTLRERVHRLVEHRQKHAVDHEGREILRDRGGLAQRLHELLGTGESHVLGGDAADHLDEFHHRHRVHEMQSDEALGPVGGGGEPGDGDRRRVGGHNRLRLEKRAKRHEDLALHRFVLGRRLDHEIRVGETLIILGVAYAGQGLFAVLLGDLAGGDLPGEVLAYDLERLVDLLLGQVVEHDFISGKRDHVRNA